MKKTGDMKWWIVMALMSLAIAALLVGLRRTSGFAATVELPAYDFLTQSTWPWISEAHPAITLVTMSNESYWRGLNDANLASLLEKLVSARPSVIAVDLIRDNPLPPGTDELRDLIVGHPGRPPTILMACGLPDIGGKEGFRPPAFLRSPDLLADHVGLAVMPEDRPGRPMVRRGLVAVHGGSLLSLSALAAVKHLTYQNPERLAQTYERLAEISSLPPNAGGYAEKTEAGNQFLLKPVPGIAGIYQPVAAESLGAMDAAALADQFAGKIIFIGTEAVLSQDEKPVVGNPDLRGVWLLAHTTAQLLRELDEAEAPVAWTSDLIEDSAIFLAATLVTLACVCLPGPLWLRILATVPVLSSCWIFTGMWLLEKGTWLPIGAPVIATVLCGISSHSWLFLRERRDRKAIYSLMEQHLSPEVTGAIWENNEALLKGQGPPPEMIVATAMFADLKGYSGITADFQTAGKNREFIAWLNRYLRAVIPLIRAESGFVQQFAGDGIFVIFGFPASRGEAHASQAVRCAKAIAATVAALNRDNETGLPPYLARIGIYTGEIICGTVGDQSHASYSFFGSTINKAARLEALQKSMHDVAKEPVRILVSEPTRIAAAGSAEMVPFLDGPALLDPNLPPENVWKIS